MLTLCDKYRCVRNAKYIHTWGTAAVSFVNELGRRIAAVTGDQRATQFLKQRLSLAVQRGNAAAIRGTFAQSSTDNSFYH